MSENSIKVAVRVRPLSEAEQARIPSNQPTSFLGDGFLAGGGTPRKEVSMGFGHGGRGFGEIINVLDHRTLVFDAPDTNPIARFGSSISASGGRRYKDARYCFDRVFEKTATQEQVFENTALPLLPGLLDGFNATVFAYGATGCGKTHTINGQYDEDTWVDPSDGRSKPRKILRDKGVIQLTMDSLFQLIEENSDKLEAQVSFSYLEIYNETIRDLLTDTEPPRNGLALRKDEKSRISVVGLTEIKPSNPEDIHEAIESGNKRRRTEMTNANKTSSRSHAVLQINVVVKPREAGLQSAITVATLSIIDLAGSERAAATSNLGARMKEGSSINKSLLALGNCINALCQRGNRHIPYRDSKLTRLLEFSLGGNCKTCMIVCVSPSSVHYDDTQNTLKYANRAKQIKTDVSRNLYNVDTHVKQYVQRISELSQTVSALQKKLDDRSSEEGAAERRRRGEMKAEVERARSDVKAKAGQTKEQIVDGAACEAIIFATEAKLRPIRSRLAEIERSSIQSALLSPAMVAERDLLLRLSRADEDLLRSASFQHRLQSASKSSAMFEGVIRAVSERRMDKLDELSIETVKGTASVCNSEMEVGKMRAREKKLVDVVQSQADKVASFAGMFARSMTVIRDAKEMLDKARVAWEGGEDPSVGEVVEAARSLGDIELTTTTILEQMVRSIVAEAAQVQSSSTSYTLTPSSSITSFANTWKAPPIASSSQPPSTFPSSSLSSKPTTSSSSSSSTVAASRRLSSAPTASRRLSLASSKAMVPSSPAKPIRSRRSITGGRASLSKSALASPRKGLLKNKPIAMSPLRPCTLKPPLSALASSSAPADGAKKTFRWRDEAGEGTIDDATRISEETGSEDAEWEDDKTEAETPVSILGPPVRPTPPSSINFKIPGLPKPSPSSWNPHGQKTSRTPTMSSLPEGNEPTSSPARQVLGEGGSSLLDRMNASLATRHHLSPSSSSSSTQDKFSLFASTKASSSRQVNGSPLRPLRQRTSLAASSPRRRDSAHFGPVRHEKKSRSARPSLNNLPPPSPGDSEGVKSSLAGGPRRMLASELGVRNSPKKGLCASTSAGTLGASRKPTRYSLSTVPSSARRSSYAPSTGPLPSYAMPTASRLAVGSSAGFGVDLASSLRAKSTGVWR